MNTFYCLDNSKLQIDFVTPIDLYEVKGSKFLCYLFPIPLSSDIYKAKVNLDSNNYCNLLFNIHKNFILEQLRRNHKKAVHFVLAFRIFNEYDHIIEGSSDDGEPKGSSGIPMLEVMRGEKLINSLCVCVRYFGGTKLGVGGLVRAYTQSSLNAILKLKDLDLLKLYKKTIVIDIKERNSNYNRIIYLVQKYNLNIISKSFLQSYIDLKIQGEEDNINKFLESYNNN